MLKYTAIVLGALAMLTFEASGCTSGETESPGSDRASSPDSPANSEADKGVGSSEASAAAVAADTPEQSAPEQETEPGKPAKPEEVPEPTSAPPEPAEEDEAVKVVEKAVLAKWADIGSLSAKTATKEEMKRGDGYMATWEGTGTYDCMRKGDTLLVRMSVSNRAIPLPGTPQGKDTSRKMETVFDGEYVYQLAEAMTMRYARKMDADRGMGFEITGPGVFEHLRRGNTLKKLADGVIDGRPVYVLEGLPKSGDQKRTHYFDKELGVVVKMVVEDQKGQRRRILLISDVKVNPEFPDDHFVFVAPPGVEIRDMTKPKEGEGEKKPPEPSQPEKAGPEKKQAATDAPPPSP